MKKRIISGAAMTLLGLLIAFGPHFLFKACEVTAESVPRCHWSVQAEIGIGIIIATLGICLVVFANPHIRFGLTAGIFFTGVVALLIPHILIGGCAMMTMACRRVTFPALSVIGILVLILSVAGIIYPEDKIKIPIAQTENAAAKGNAESAQ
jgi:hypothetical protein